MKSSREGIMVEKLRGPGMDLEVRARQKPAVEETKKRFPVT